MTCGLYNNRALLDWLGDSTRSEVCLLESIIIIIIIIIISVQIFMVVNIYSVIYWTFTPCGWVPNVQITFVYSKYKLVVPWRGRHQVAPKIIHHAIRYFKSQHQKQNISFFSKATSNSKQVPTCQCPRRSNKRVWWYRVCLEIGTNELPARNQHRVRNTTNCVPLRRSHSNRGEVNAPAYLIALVTPHKLHTNLATLHLSVDR
jgi:hypothetical protein